MSDWMMGAGQNGKSGGDAMGYAGAVTGSLGGGGSALPFGFASGWGACCETNEVDYAGNADAGTDGFLSGGDGTDQITVGAMTIHA